MANDAQVTLIGTLGKDPELRYTTGGSGVASFSIACNRSWKNKRTDEWEKETSWFNVVAWADLGEHCAESLRKGNRVIVVGRLTQRSYDDREGNKRSVTECVADAIGPDLRWATAEVTRIEREKAGSQSVDKAVYPEEEPFLMLADISDIEAVNRHGHRLLVRPWN